MPRFYIRKFVLTALLTSVPFVVDAEEGPSVPSRPNSQMQVVLDTLGKLGPKPIESLAPSDARRQPSMADAALQVFQDKGDPAPKRLPPVAKVESRTVPGAQGVPITVRVYTPEGTGPFPVVVYFHGGGWVLANLDTYDTSARAISTMAEAVVVSVDYRRAPENKFPTAHEDSYAAFQFVASHAPEFGGDPRKVAAAGESAGGNLATAICLMAHDRGGKMPIHQVLIYPVTSYGFDTVSYKANENAKPLNAAMMHWFFEKYLNSPADGANELISNVRAAASDLTALPPATIITAEIDPLRSEGHEYAEKLKDASVDVALRDYAGVTHEFFGMGLLIDEALEAEKFVAARLMDAFEK